eukprot:COSAG05_NODE_1476_length_4780_cov_9.024989_3_plen_71_part_00
MASGMGRGEYQAAFANFRALTVVAAPLFYSKLYPPPSLPHLPSTEQRENNSYLCALSISSKDCAKRKIGS